MSNYLHAITLECAEVGRVAHFWSEVLDRPLDPGASEQFAVIGLAERSSPLWVFMLADGAPTVHPDISTSDLDAETERLVRLGAIELEHFDIPGGPRYSQFADPEGNHFDVAAR